MSPDELSAALEQLSPTRAADQAALAGLVQRDATALTVRAVELTAAPDPALAENARALVGSLEEAAVGALLTAAPAGSVSDEVWRLRTAAAAAIALRARVATRLMSLLTDQRPVPFPSGYEGLARPPQSRVCDEAYVALRELANVAESRGAFTVDRRVFLRLAVEEKDAEIASVVGGLPFTRFVEDAEV